METLVMLRKRADLSQEQLAHRAGITTNAVSKIERGVSDPKRSTLVALAKALGVEVGELFPVEQVA